MGSPDFLCRIASALAVLAGLAAGQPATGYAAGYSAAGTHQCKAADGAAYRCVVTGALFGNCAIATSSLRAQDCCPSSKECSRDSQGRLTNCRGEGASIDFAMKYCIPDR